jgi:hypothetical protein
MEENEQASLFEVFESRKSREIKNLPGPPNDTMTIVGVNTGGKNRE